MKAHVLVLSTLALVVFSGVAYCESNALSVGVEKVTKAPFTLLKDGNEHLFTPVKEIDRATLGFSDNARAAAVSVGLNFGEPVKE